MSFQLTESATGIKSRGRKCRYDQRVRYPPPEASVKVLIRNLGPQGKPKLADRWSSTPYMMESQVAVK